MTVAENLKLRSAEHPSSKVLTVMSAGTKLKVLELGKEEIINGIKIQLNLQRKEIKK
jgi:hypothetical protein